jgi:hypothetical protein
MKQIVKLSAFIMILITFLSGCQTIDNTRSGNSGTITKSGDENGSYTFDAEVIDAKENLLVAPDAKSNEFRSSDKISVGTTDADITGMNEGKLTKDDLKAGDLIKITYNGIIEETYPARITADFIEVTGHNLLIDGYLALIDDLYQEDSGLNSDITVIGFDTSGWSGLSDIEKEIIFKAVKESYGVDIVEGTSDELAEQGLIDKDNLFFPNGILITLGDLKYNDRDQKITCSVKKWRSGDGAIGANEVTAKYKDGEWKITKSGMWIS